MVHTSVKPIAIHHALPDSSIFGGGDVRVLAVQARYAVNDRLAVIATKDGYVDFDPDVGSHESGLADVAAGAKTVLVDDREGGFLLTGGLVVEIDAGEKEVFQGNGDFTLRPFASAGWDLGAWNVLGGLGFDLPLDTDANTSRVDYHAHVDYEVSPGFYPLVELNGITYLSDGDELPVDFEGGDFFNLGSTDVAGQTVVTGALGARMRLFDEHYLGFAYEAPLTDREDLFDWRATVDFLFLF